MLVHPSHGHFDDTLGNFLMDYYKQSGDESDFHPVHRLDKGTSGLLAVAKHPHAQERLKRQLHTGDFRRTYLAVCDGAPPAPDRTVDAPIGRVDGSLTARAVRPDGQPARTHYRVVRSCGPRTLLELTWTRAAPTRSGCIWPTWAVPSPGISCTAGQTRH